jgi:hypothetical protein
MRATAQQSRRPRADLPAKAVPRLAAECSHHGRSRQALGPGPAERSVTATPGELGALTGFRRQQRCALGLRSLEVLRERWGIRDPCHEKEHDAKAGRGGGTPLDPSPSDDLAPTPVPSRMGVGARGADCRDAVRERAAVQRPAPRSVSPLESGV